MSFDAKIVKTDQIIKRAIKLYQPSYIVSMVSGGKDSACNHAVLEELGVKIDLVIHGNTRCGIPDTTKFVTDYYGTRANLEIADAGTAYEAYVTRKGFFGKGIGAHGYSYRILKAAPFRKVLSRTLRQKRRGIRILLLSGTRQDETENRKKHLVKYRADPGALSNIWVSSLFNWTQDERDAYLTARGIPINPVAKALCRSGECMCGTMQTKLERMEASILYPEWGDWLNELEALARKLHGFGWGEPFKKQRNEPNTFQPMCHNCVKRTSS